MVPAYRSPGAHLPQSAPRAACRPSLPIPIRPLPHGPSIFSCAFRLSFLRTLTPPQGFEYSRAGNPNRNALEATLASLESGGAHALAFASGSACTAAVIQALGTGAHVLSVDDVYGGTRRYLTQVATATQGLETTFVDLERAGDDEILAAIRPNTKVRPPPFFPTNLG